jgi:hypothetical protein
VTRRLARPNLPPRATGLQAATGPLGRLLDVYQELLQPDQYRALLETLAVRVAGDIARTLYAQEIA